MAHSKASRKRKPGKHSKYTSPDMTLYQYPKRWLISLPPEFVRRSLLNFFTTRLKRPYITVSVSVHSFSSIPGLLFRKSILSVVLSSTPVRLLKKITSVLMAP